MTPKAILFDVDGVILQERDKLFSERIVEDTPGIDSDSVITFFKNDYNDIMLGKKDIKDILRQYLKSWKWQGTVEELLRYWYSYEDVYNQEVLDLVKDLRAKGIKCYMASDHSKYRADDLMNSGKLKDLFDGGYFSGYLGCTKEEAAFFVYVLEDLNLDSHDILFIDDDPKNVEVAQGCGISGIHFVEVDDLKEKLG